MKRVLITDYVHPDLVEGLEGMGYSVNYDRNYPPELLEDVLPELHGIVVNTKSRMTRKRIESAGKLEFIARLGSGLDIIDLEAAEERGIAIINTPEGNCDAVAEHVIGMMLCLANNLRHADRQVREKIWEREKNRGFELAGKKLGIVGMGNTGCALAHKLSTWGLKLMYYDPYVEDLPGSFEFITKLSWSELIEQADIISFHVQFTKETHHMADEDFFKKCKEGLILVNSSRGAVVDTEAMVGALQSGKLGGACLDVFENEKPGSFTPKEEELYSRLFSMENVVLSPHIAGWTHESLQRIAHVMLQKLQTHVKMS
jgi:D-3-phosphoglycerate dehydrogenase